MNKESLTAIVVGLLIGTFIFLVVKKTEKLFFWRRASLEQTLDQSLITPPAETPFEVDDKNDNDSPMSTLQILNPKPYFLNKDKKINFKVETASGSGLIIRVNNKVDFDLVSSQTWAQDLNLESGANLIEISMVDMDNLAVLQTSAINGVVSTKKYPDSAQAGSGTLVKVSQDQIEIKADDGRVLEFMVKPDTRLYAFNDQGRLVSLTQLDDNLQGKRAIFIFAKQSDRLNLIKLQIIKNWQLAQSQTFVGKISKLDDDKQLYQIVDVKNQVVEIVLNNKVKLYNTQGQQIKAEDISLGDRVLIFSLADKSKLVIVSPQTNLLEK